MKKLIVIDGYSLLFRAYYATAYKGEDTILKTSFGLPINAIFTFANMVFPILSKLGKDDGIVVALDTGHKTKRHEIYKEYKANRTAVPESLTVQMPILREFLDSLNVFHYEETGYEGDDVAGSIAKQAQAQGIDVEVYSSDHDYLQLVDDHIIINLIKKGTKDIVPETMDNFYELNNFYPSQLADYKGLRGDSSDNLIGIPGVGDKTAILLLNEYKTLDNLYANIDAIKGKLKENLITYKDQGLLSRELAVIDINLALPFKMDSLLYKGYEFDKINSFIQKYELKSMVGKLGKLKEYKKVQEISLDFENPKYIQIPNCKNLENIKSLGIGANYDYDNYHKSKVEGFALFDGNDNFYITYLDAKKDEYFKKILENGSVIKFLYDYKALYYILKKINIHLSLPTFDLALAVYMLDSNQKTDIITCFHYFDTTISDKETDPITHCVDVAQKCFELEDNVIKMLKQKDLFELYNTVEIPLSKVLSDMEYEGFPLDKEILLSFKKEYEEKIASLQNAIFEMAGEEFNIASPTQLGPVLKRMLGIDDDKKLKTTSIDMLKHYDDNPFVALVLDYRKYNKLLSTYVLGLLDSVYSDGKIHCIFNQTTTTTGRLSCSEPNLQNITVRDEEGKYIRKAFYYKDENYVILSFDYSQIELRLLAHIANCPKLQQAFINNEDIHTSTAKYIFNKDSVTALERRKAKAVNFGIVYGISDYGLKEQIGVPLTEAKEIITRFYENYPEVRLYANNTIKNLEKYGYVKTIFNRIRYIPEIFDPDFHKREFAKRAATNVPIQGSAADLIKIAMIHIADLLKGYDSKMVLQIHDELIFKMNVNELESLMPKIKELMENVIKLNVPLKVDGGYAKDWYSVK